MSTFNYTRRGFLKASSLITALFTFHGCRDKSRQLTIQTSENQPNVLIIHADQHRIDSLGAYGNHDIKTPNIDRLAKDGVRYENSFCPFPVCTPSRYSLLSGQYVHEHNGWNNRSTLSPYIDTFPKILRSAGYRTMAVGKMHFTPTYLDVGFDEMCLSEQDGPGRWDDDYHRYLMRLGLVDRNDLEDQRDEYRRNAAKTYWDNFGALSSNLPQEHYSTTWIADRAMESLQTWNFQTRNLLMVGFIKPHHPFDPPTSWHDLYDPERLQILPGWTEDCFDYDLKYNRGYFPHHTLTKAKLKRVMAYYYAMISQIDYQVGRMVEYLKNNNFYDNTMIVYTSDHGDYMGYHHLLLKGNHMYDPLVKVPLIIKWPKNRRAGVVSHRMVSNIDLAPTICRAAGCRVGTEMHGQDLFHEDTERQIVFAESRNGHQVMARSPRYKLILTDPQHANLFFDLEKDPLEMKNLYYESEYRSEVYEMEEILTTWRCKNPKPNAYIDQDAPEIQQPNVPPKALSHRDEIIKYYRRKMD